MSYFGTDGIRQAADAFTPDFINSIIAGLADYAGTDKKVLLAGDTRESSEWILQDLATALESLGFEYASAGVLPTPAINYCFYEMGFDFAIDVTASHNPYTDNGIKIFERGDKSGVKATEACRQAIESAISSHKTISLISPTDRADLHDEAVALYKKHLTDYLGSADFTGLRIGMDCANGATSVINKEIFTSLGADVTLISANASYGQLINKDCGSTHLDALKSLVTANHLDFGVAYDGDGDRCLMIDADGHEVDGDEIIAILANYLHLDHIAITVMANQGLLNWAKDANVNTEITPVGDSNVAAAMQEKSIQLGGEQSGHIILPGETTGDGMLTSLMVAKVISETKSPLHDLASIVTKFPQVIVNLAATPAQKSALATNDAYHSIIAHFEDKVKSACAGRLLVRPSGTENLIRITIWGDDAHTIATLAEELKLKLGETL